jgi:hypothetical protein
MDFEQFHLCTSLNSRASEEAKKASRDCVDSQIIKTRLNKQQRYVFKFVNSDGRDLLYIHLISCTVSNYFLAAGKMPPRNPTTRCSPRAPKLKEAETGEGSSPGTVRQLEYAPRAEPVIKTSTKKSFVQPLVFGDTEENTGSKVMLPQWGDLFNRISREEYPECIPHNDPDVRALDDQVFPNI